MKVFLLLSQQLGFEQITELRSVIGGAYSLVSLPVYFLEFFNQVDPGRPFPEAKAQQLLDWLEETSAPDDVVLLHGEGGLTAFLVDGCRELGLRALYSTVSRQAQEVHNADGTLSVRHIEQHRGFRAYPDALTGGDPVRRALLFAHRIHQKQVRKGGSIPYFAHLSEVMALVMTYAPQDRELQVAALLHDAAEDQGGEPMLKKIRHRFGSRVADLVAFCSDSLAENPERKAPWRQRKERYIARLSTASADALLVVLCDKVANLRSIVEALADEGEQLWSRFHPDADQRWYYAQVWLAVQARQDLPRPLMREFARLISALGSV